MKAAREPSSLQKLREDLVFFWESTLGILGEDHRAVYNDIEDAVASTDQFGVHAGLVFNGGRQTGGLGAVVSLPAIGN